MAEIMSVLFCFLHSGRENVYTFHFELNSLFRLPKIVPLVLPCNINYKYKSASYVEVVS